MLSGACRGFVEISVFETGVPPRFRLYFVGPDGTPPPAPDPAAVRVETVRPSGARQRFAFVSGGSYLESAEDILEPHELSANLRWDGHELPETRFTEHDHGHEGSGGPHGGHGHHGHSHGASAHDTGIPTRSGLPGWCGGVFGHSHFVAERVDDTMESNERGIWAIKISLGGLGLTALFRVVIERVRARWIGHRVYGDIEVGVDPSLSLGDAHLITEKVRKQLRAHVRPLADAVVKVRPVVEDAVSAPSTNRSAVTLR
jgi:hypothetical protein